MRMQMKRQSRPAGQWVAAALALTMSLGGCGLDQVKVPDLAGPSTYGISILLTVNRDVLVADGGDFAVVTATVRGPNGQPAPGMDVFFAVADAAGNFADIGVIVGQNGPGTGATVRTNQQGIAQVVYEAPPRTDNTANNSVLILARVVTNDAQGNHYRSVRIELRSAQPRIFPNPNPAGAVTCHFITEPAAGPFNVGSVIGFHSTSTGPIIRYEWNFCDNTVGDAPDEAKVYGAVGTYAVIHTVTDVNGVQSTCAALNIVVVSR
jgi:PKD repeat protein